MIPQNHPESTLSVFLRRFRISRLLGQAGIRKSTLRASPVELVQFLLGLIFTHQNLWQWWNSDQYGDAPFRKSTVYAFLDSPRWHWRRVLLHLGVAVVAWLKPLATRDGVFIVE